MEHIVYHLREQKLQLSQIYEWKINLKMEIETLVLSVRSSEIYQKKPKNCCWQFWKKIFVFSFRS